MLRMNPGAQQAKWLLLLLGAIWAGCFTSAAYAFEDVWTQRARGGLRRSSFTADGLSIPDPSERKGIRVDPTSQKFVDETGRVIVFHGLNAVYKLPPFHPQFEGFNVSSSLSEIDMKNLRKWGMNMLRLGVLWEAVEPHKNEPNTTYLNQMTDLIDRLGQYGIYSIVDAHQDLFSRRFCGEGTPDWAVDSGNLPEQYRFPFPIPVNLTKDSNGFPNLTQCVQDLPFSYWDIALELETAWGNFYKNNESISAFARYWSEVAAAMNASEYVLGYELLNEPWPSNIYKDPLFPLIPGLADKQNLAPLYDQLYTAIRRNDPNHIVFYEPTITESSLLQSPGFKHGPGGFEDNDKQAYAYHMYCLGVNKTGNVGNATVCDAQLNYNWEIARNATQRLGGGHFITEFGAVGQAPASIQTMNTLLDLADTALESWSYWTFKHFADYTTQDPASETLYHDNGTLQMEKLKTLSRTYAQKIAGIPDTIYMHFAHNSSTKEFNLSYEINPKATVQETVVYYNSELHYPRGYSANVTPPGIAKVVPGDVENRLLIEHSPGSTGRIQFRLVATQ
eukprot:gb/GECG01007444.1/.p1 GENE.gb/GECG01007444.1/~~gb/GECG01007444.1/.p1  ORF type:complete len:562 (+),score=47.45 gb/GECG01007444.1/:1-1686(+)